MQKQRKGFWLFICSLIPGAGEMYMGFMKQGISIMLLFWSIVGIAGGFNLGFLVMFLPVIWFYSFFNVHNLKSLPEEEFYSIEDDYILHLDKILGSSVDFLPKYSKLLAVLMIIFGCAILWNNFMDILYWIFPSRLSYLISDILYQIPQFIVAVAIILAGYYMLTGKKKNIGHRNIEEEPQEHYWEPYQPYQQPSASQTSEEPADFLQENENSHDSAPQTASKAEAFDQNQPPLPSSLDSKQ